MKIPETIRNLTPEIMEAYLAGKLTDAQQHQVEKLMLDDDFAAEATEGLEMLGVSERAESIGSLERRLEKRIQPKGKSRTVTWYAIAAAFVILISATYLLIRNPAEVPLEGPAIAQSDPIEDEPLAMNSPEPETKELEEAAEELPNTSSAAPQDDRQRSKNMAIAESEQQASTFNDSVGIELGDVSPERLSQIDAAQMDTLGVVSAIPGAEALDETPSASGRIRGDEIPLNAQRLAGRVILQDGMPVSNVDVLIDGAAYTTDDEGYFEINASDDDQIVFSMMGLKKKELSQEEKNEEGSLSVVMDQESSTLSELMVSATPAERISTRGARPAINEEGFQRYLKENLEMPAVDNPVRGTVVIRVTIEIDGTISNTKIIRSLGEPYDVEAIRLIREGPAWEPALKRGLPVKDKVRVKVDFTSE